MAKFINVRRQEVLLMEVEHGIYSCTYVRWAPEQWFYTAEDHDLIVVSDIHDVNQLEKMYSASVLEAVTKK